MDDPTTRYVLTVLSSVFLGALALWALKREGISLTDIGLDMLRLREANWLIAAIWLAMGLGYYALAGEAVLDHVSPALILMQQWIFVGIAEELLFRGYLLSRRSAPSAPSPISPGGGQALETIIGTPGSMRCQLLTTSLAAPGTRGLG